MRTRLVTAAFIAAFLITIPGSDGARAQLSGMPVWNNAARGTGLFLAADAAYPEGSGSVYALRAEAGLGPLRAGASMGRDEESARSFMGSLRFFGGGLNPLSMNAQAGYGSGTDAASEYTRYTAAVGLGLSPPVPGFDLSPWISPGVRFTDRSGEGTEARFGFAAGLSATFGLLGAHVGIDREDGRTTTGIGVHLGIAGP